MEYRSLGRKSHGGTRSSAHDAVVSSSKRRKTIGVGVDYKENTKNPKDRSESLSKLNDSTITKKSIVLGAATSACYFDGAPPTSTTPLQAQLYRQEQARKLLDNSMMNDSNPPTNSSYLSSSSSDMSQDHLNVSILSDTTEHAASMHVKLPPTQVGLGPSRPPLQSRRQTIDFKAVANKPQRQQKHGRRMTLGPRAFSEQPADEHTGELLLSPSVMQSLLHAGTESDEEDTAPPRRESLSYGDAAADRKAAPGSRITNEDHEATEASLRHDGDITTDVGDLLQKYRSTTSTDKLEHDDQNSQEGASSLGEEVENLFAKLSAPSPGDDSGVESSEDEASQADPTTNGSSPNVGNLLAKYDMLTQMSIPRADGSSKMDTHDEASVKKNLSLKKDTANRSSKLLSDRLGAELLAQLSAPSPNGSEDSLLVQENSVAEARPLEEVQDDKSSSLANQLGCNVDTLLAKLSASSPNGTEESLLVQEDSVVPESVAEDITMQQNDEAPSSQLGPEVDNLMAKLSAPSPTGSVESVLVPVRDKNEFIAPHQSENLSASNEASSSQLGLEVDSLWAKLSTPPSPSSTVASEENATNEKMCGEDDITRMADADRKENLREQNVTTEINETEGINLEISVSQSSSRSLSRSELTMKVDSSEVQHGETQAEESAMSSPTKSATGRRLSIPSESVMCDSPARNTRSAKKTLASAEIIQGSPVPHPTTRSRSHRSPSRGTSSATRSEGGSRKMQESPQPNAVMHGEDDTLMSETDRKDDVSDHKATTWNSTNETRGLDLDTSCQSSSRNSSRPGATTVVDSCHVQREETQAEDSAESSPTKSAAEGRLSTPSDSVMCDSPARNTRSAKKSLTSAKKVEGSPVPSPTPRRQSYRSPNHSSSRIRSSMIRIDGDSTCSENMPESPQPSMQSPARTRRKSPSPARVNQSLPDSPARNTRSARKSLVNGATAHSPSIESLSEQGVPNSSSRLSTSGDLPTNSSARGSTNAKKSSRDGSRENVQEALSNANTVVGRPLLHRSPPPRSPARLPRSGSGTPGSGLSDSPARNTRSSSKVARSNSTLSEIRFDPKSSPVAASPSETATDGPNLTSTPPHVKPSRKSTDAQLPESPARNTRSAKKARTEASSVHSGMKRDTGRSQSNKTSSTARTNRRMSISALAFGSSTTDSEPYVTEDTTDLFGGMLPPAAVMATSKDSAANMDQLERDDLVSGEETVINTTISSQADDEAQTGDKGSGVAPRTDDPLLHSAFEQNDEEPLGSFIQDDDDDEEEEQTSDLYGGMLPKKNSTSEREKVTEIDGQFLNETVASVDLSKSSTATESMGGLLDQFKSANTENATETSTGMLRSFFKDDPSRSSVTATATESVGVLLDGFRVTNEAGDGDDVRAKDTDYQGEATSTETVAGILDGFRDACGAQLVGVADRKQTSHEKDRWVESSDSNQTDSSCLLPVEEDSTNVQGKPFGTDAQLENRKGASDSSASSYQEDIHSFATRASVSPSSAITTPHSMGRIHSVAPPPNDERSVLPITVEFPMQPFAIGLQTNVQFPKKTSLTPTKLTGSPRRLLDHERFTASPRRRTSHTQLRKTPIRFSLPPTAPRSSRKSALTPTRLKARRPSRLTGSPGADIPDSSDLPTAKPLETQTQDIDSTVEQNTTPSKKDKLPSALRNKTSENRNRQKSKRVNFGSPEMAEYNVLSPSTSYTPISSKRNLFVPEGQKSKSAGVNLADDSDMSTDSESSQVMEKKSQEVMDDTWDTNAILGSDSSPENIAGLVQTQHSMEETTMVLEADLATALGNGEVVASIDPNAISSDQLASGDDNCEDTWDTHALGIAKDASTEVDSSIARAQSSAMEPTIVLEDDLETALGVTVNNKGSGLSGDTQSSDHGLPSREEEHNSRLESAPEAPEHTVELEMSMEMILWPGKPVDDSPLPPSSKSKSFHRMSIAPENRLSITDGDVSIHNILENSLSRVLDEPASEKTHVTAVPTLTVAQILPQATNFSMPSLKRNDFLLQCVERLSAFPISKTLHDTLSEVATMIAKVTPGEHDPESIIVPSGDDNTAYFSIQEHLQLRTASAVESVERMREYLHDNEGVQYLKWLVSVLHELVSRLSENSKDLSTEISEVDDLMNRAERCTTFIANHAAASTRRRLVRQRQLEIASLKEEIDAYEEEIDSTQKGLECSRKTLEQFQQFENLVSGNDCLHSRDKALSDSVESKAISYSIQIGLQQFQLKELTKRSFVFHFVGLCPSSCAVIEFIRSPSFKCQASPKPDLFPSHHLIKAEKLSPVSSFLRTRFALFCAGANGEQFSSVKEIGPLLRKMEYQLSGIDAVALELASLKRNYNSSLVPMDIPSGDFRFEVEFNAKGTNVMRASFIISDTYPHGPMETSFEVFFDGFDIPFLFRLLAKNAKPGYGYLTRTVSFIEGFVATSSH